MTPSPPGLKLAVTPMSHRHLDQVAAIEQACFPRPWSRKLFAAEIKHRHALPLVALTLPAGLVAGYLCLWLVAGEAQVQNLAVNPAFRRRGVGRLLLLSGLREAARRGCTEATLEVRPSNLAARRLYSSLGFGLQGRRPRYYAPEGEDALLMSLDLGSLPRF